MQLIGFVEEAPTSAVPPQRSPHGASPADHFGSLSHVFLQLMDGSGLIYEHPWVGAADEWGTWVLAAPYGKEGATPATMSILFLQITPNCLVASF